MLKKKTFRQLFIRKDSSSSLRNTPSLQVSIPSEKYYQSIYQLPLNRFIDCMVDKNLYALVISGAPTKEQLAKAWSDIRMEYTDKIADHEYRVYLDLFKEINVIKNNMDQVNELINLLKYNYVKQFADRLNRLLITNFVFDVEKPAEYDKLLQRCYNMTGGLRLRLDVQILNFQAIEAKHKDHKAPTRDYYLSLLITLSDNAGYALPENMTTFEFCERMARAHRKNEALKKQPNVRRKN